MTFRTLTAALMLVLATGSLHAQQMSREEAQKLRAACEADIRRLCPGISPGGGRLMACVREKPDQLSRPCAEALKAAAAAKAQKQ